MTTAKARGPIKWRGVPASQRAAIIRELRGGHRIICTTEYDVSAVRAAAIVCLKAAAKKRAVR